MVAKEHDARPGVLFLSVAKLVLIYGQLWKPVSGYGIGEMFAAFVE